VHRGPVDRKRHPKDQRRSPPRAQTEKGGRSWNLHPDTVSTVRPSDQSRRRRGFSGMGQPLETSRFRLILVLRCLRSGKYDGCYLRQPINASITFRYRL
jgi:hypothetical protein